MNLDILIIAESENEVKYIRDKFPDSVTFRVATSPETAMLEATSANQPNLIMLTSSIKNFCNDDLYKSLSQHPTSKNIPISQISEDNPSGIVSMSKEKNRQYLLHFVGDWQEQEAYSVNFQKVSLFFFEYNKKILNQQLVS